MSEFEQALAKEIARLKDRLSRLMGMSSTPAKRGRKPGSKNKPKPTAKAKRTTKPVSAARRKQMKEHGRYLGAVRRLSKAHRAQVKAVRQKSGVTAAISEARKLAAK